MSNKLGLGIIAFDDTCHLKNITSEIRDLCDVITVCLQRESWHGDPISEDVIKYVESLKSEGLVDEIVWFESKADYSAEDQKIVPRLIETDKRNFTISFLEGKGCTHAHIIDSDEFYDHDDYKRAKDLVMEKDDIHVSYCQYINYYRDYRHLLVWPFLCYVPFISEIKFRFDFKGGTFDKPSDPTRRYVIENKSVRYCIFSYSIIKMHHLSWIRKNIEDKIDNWSSKKYFDGIPGLRERILDSYYNYEEGNNAVIMFNVPENSVVVNTLPEAYIHPKYSLFEV